ncbi:hypothetical protein, partial [Corallococcus sp. AB045]|uniref:hypothetical protein n=1 Tax=Corallococcus sp. AB045 TaxID=2316719 RepID=UPI003515E81E
VWEDLSGTGGDTSGRAIRGQLFKADGSPKGGELLINTTTAGDQMNPELAVLDDDRFAVTWESVQGTTGGIRASVFNSEGLLFDTEKLVFSFIGRQQKYSKAAFVKDGNNKDWLIVGNSDYYADQVYRTGYRLEPTSVVQAYQSTNNDYAPTSEVEMVGLGDRYAIFSKWRGLSFALNIFRTDGASHRIALPASTANYAKDQLDTAVLADGKFVLVYRTTDLVDGSSSSIRAQMFNNDGTLFGSDFQVNSSTTGAQTTPQVTALATGGFAIVFNDYVDSNDVARIRTFDAKGVPQGNDERIFATHGQNGPTITGLADGRIMFAWTENSTGTNDGVDIRGQIFDMRTSAVTVKGTAGADHYYGTAWNDTFTGAGGNDTLEGGGGTNTAIFSGNASAYTVTQNSDGTTTVTGPDGTDTLKNIRILQFKDQTVLPAGNTAPSAPSLSSTQASEDMLTTSIVATLASADADGDPLTYSLDATDGPFRIDGNLLVLT